MESQTLYTGIDISKLTFDAAIPQSGKYVHHKFTNDAAGFRQLLKLLNAAQQVVMEASGPYYLPLACFLFDHGIALSVVNPLRIRRFCQMRMIRAKTDKKDAMMIAEYGRTEKPDLWQKPEGHMIALQQRETVLGNLQKQQAALHNQFESLHGSGMLDKELKKDIEKGLKQVGKLIEKITADMEKIAETHYAELLKNLQTIPGIGKKTAITLTIATSGFSRFANYRKLCSYIGICPRIFESGTSVKGKARITKMGMSEIRRILYVCSWSAKAKNRACKVLYDRLLAKGKSKKLALIAVANKLIKQAFAIATQKTQYHENYSKSTCI